MAIYENILHTVGRTPVVRINRLGPHGIDLYAKIEAFNPMGSVKDRIAVAIIEDAERNGQLRPGQTVVEATSGNTGIALAMVCAQKGYPLVVTMAENFSVERRRLMRFLGARVVLTPAAQKGSGMLRKAMELAARHDWFLCRQFENDANAEAHIRTTAMEILDDFEGKRLDYVVTGSGTGGTVNGIARALKARRPETKIVLCEPANSPTIAGFVADPALTGSVEESHPAFRPHPIQGWTPDFIPKLALDALRAGLIDTILPVQGADALARSRELARKEGIFCGISAGATFAGALEVARAAQAGSAILCLLPDTGERYQSTPLFDGIDVDMTDEELEISNSTPSACFLLPAVVGKPAVAATYLPTQAAVDFVEATVSDPRTPVVMFGLEWCEFSWSMRKFLAAHDIEVKAIELDAAEFPMRHESTAIRNALQQRTGSATIPQLVVAGEYVGGCTDAFDAWNEGRLKTLLRSAGVRFTASGVDPYGFLPRWTQSRERPRHAAV